MNEGELRDGVSSYRLGDLAGKAGLEKAWDNDLHGTAGGEEVEVDALGRRVRVLQQVPDMPGNTLTLTLDRDLQETAENALGTSDGAIVALDPRNGEVLVMVSHPAYDANIFARGIRRDEWRALVQDPKHPLNNRAVQGQFPPGSTFKIAVAAAALERGVATPSTSVSCSGGIPFGNRRCGSICVGSSFGSNGSRNGVLKESALGMLSSPNPDALSNPGAPISVDDRRISSKSCVLSSSGRSLQTHAAAPATMGEAKLVPLASV